MPSVIHHIKGNPWQLGEILDFGKHAGRKIDNVIRDEPGYITWCFENIEEFDLDDEAMHLLEQS